MKHRKRFNFIFSMVVLLTISIYARAFAPDYPAALVPGEHHTRIILEALDEIYADYGYGPSGQPYTNNMRMARDAIADADASVDRGTLKEKPDWHCDDERLSQCSNNVKSETTMGVQKILISDFTSARETIGRVNHTLQDFYSHSNWVELRGSVVNPEMGYGNLSNLALEREQTCNPSTVPAGLGAAIACSYMGSGSILSTSKLTSGYFVTDSSKGVPEGKCSHGGSLDGGLLGPDLRDGINKDVAVCWYAGLVISPHSTYHYAAALSQIPFGY